MLNEKIFGFEFERDSYLKGKNDDMSAMFELEAAHYKQQLDKKDEKI